jgi:hypothetical protein
MLDNKTKLNIAVTRFAGFVAELPVSPSENDVSEYHDIVELFEEGCGHDLSQFKIAPDRLKPAIGGPLPSRYEWQTRLKKPPVEFRYFLGQVRGLTNYLMTVVGCRPC